MLILRIAIDVLIAIGAIFALAGTLGVMRMPDTFCRMQASTCVTTLGVIGVAWAHCCTQSLSWAAPPPP